VDPGRRARGEPSPGVPRSAPRNRSLIARKGLSGADSRSEPARADSPLPGLPHFPVPRRSAPTRATTHLALPGARRSGVDIIITGGGHVQSNRGRRVIAEGSEVIDPAADALAAAAARPGCATVGLVELDRAADERDVGRAEWRGAVDEDAAALAVAPVPPGRAGAARGQIP